jgi:hypothetical protein
VAGDEIKIFRTGHIAWWFLAIQSFNQGQGD